MEIIFKNKWYTGLEFDLELSNQYTDNHLIELSFHYNTKLRVDSVTRMLSLICQLHKNGQTVSLNFQSTRSPLLNYLHTIEFFKFLPKNGILYSERIAPQLNSLSKGSKKRKSYCAIEPIVCGQEHTEDLDALVTPFHEYFSTNVNEVRKSYIYRVKTILSELINNIHEHSESKLTGYAATQMYNRSLGVITVCDSGIGLLSTIKASIVQNYPQHQDLSDEQILNLMFEKGISRHHDTFRGQGLTSSAKNALVLNASVDLRLKESHIHLEQRKVRDTFKTWNVLNRSSSKIHPLLGTHFTFQFDLQNISL
ncbi:hypothetical protein [Pseudoalteromonas byunsanensis]|uniref:Uncharacterized protein n=1 Tax=Pseudoalteromonas byunsanensis TaxID=327939 RepID=A0A1S1N3P1_9GAMM|nr:hypothetical protein [Pseudoalteromonas byunsanensis]OHU93943.1 hypothetical protein BIW53_17110 [Pseudoalteromonas byunsanensis]